MMKRAFILGDQIRLVKEFGPGVMEQPSVMLSGALEILIIGRGLKIALQLGGMKI